MQAYNTAAINYHTLSLWININETTTARISHHSTCDNWEYYHQIVII
jgi:hypothetical protein